MTERDDCRIEALNARISDLEQRMKDRFMERDKAITLAADATDKRFYAVNEFRQALSDQTSQYLKASVFETAHSVLGEKVETVTKQVIAIDSSVRSALSSATNGPAFLISISSVSLLLIIAVITSAIQLGAVQTHVTIDTETLASITERERHNANDDAKRDAAIEVIRTQEAALLVRLNRIESFFFGNKTGFDLSK